MNSDFPSIHRPARGAARWQSAAASWLCAAAALLLSACGGGDSDAGNTPSAPAADTARAQSASIGPDGGQVSTTTASGVPITLFVPPRALRSTQTITLTPIVHMGRAPLAGGLVAAVQMEPSGLVFDQPATLRFGAVVQAPAGKRVVAFGSANDGSRFALNVAVTVGTGSSAATEMTVAHFSDAGLATGTEQEIADAAAAFVPEPGELSRTGFQQTIHNLANQGASDTQLAVHFDRWFAAFVKPAIEAAAASGSPADQLSAYSEWLWWIDWRQRLQTLEPTFRLDTLLAAQDAVARPVVAAVLVRNVDESIANCQQRANLRALAQAAFEQSVVKRYQFDSPELALDTATFLRKLNTCARPVLDPIRLPATLTAATSVSMDARALVVFAGVPDPVGAPFSFAVTPISAAVGTPQGNSDAQGRFTTVVTPQASSVLLDVKACYVANEFGVLLPTDICVTQQVTNVAPDGILRGTVSLSAQSSTTTTVLDPNLGSAARSNRAAVEASAQVEVNLRTGASRIVSKSAQFSAFESLDQFGPTIAAAPGCLTRRHESGSVTSTGSSFVVSSIDGGSIRFSGNNYTLTVNGLTGPVRQKGNFRVKFETVSGTCPPAFSGEGDRTTDFTPTGQSYLPSGVSIEGSGAVQTNADGSFTVAGTRTASQPVSGPGSSGNVTYTLTWNLTGRF